MKTCTHSEGFDLQTLKSELPPIIARKKVGHYLGGLISSKTLANADSLGTGPRQRIKIGRDVAYPTSALLDWLNQNSRLIETKEVL